mmetsp:Transcript_64598/g.135575  ORF Transcript_64598/g.135575 Transcript_64598/m.135575 type:complete len:99 (+) Transcript_64598:3-299(+)
MLHGGDREKQGPRPGNFDAGWLNPLGVLSGMSHVEETMGREMKGTEANLRRLPCLAALLCNFGRLECKEATTKKKGGVPYAPDFSLTHSHSHSYSHSV